jgi:hypothetical protein
VGFSITHGEGTNEQCDDFFRRRDHGASCVTGEAILLHILPCLPRFLQQPLTKRHQILVPLRLGTDEGLTKQVL